MNEVLIFDLETTGTDTGKDRIVQIGFVKLSADNDIIIEKERLINPGIPITAAAAEVHDITNEMVANEPTFKQVAQSLLQFISSCKIIAGYNSNSFDLPILYAEFVRAGIDWDYSQHIFIDACIIFKRKEPRDLVAAMKFYCDAEMNESRHSALYDAKCTAKVLAAQIAKYGLNDEKELALYCNYDKPFVDMGGWFDENKMLAKGKSKGTQDKGFIEWMLKLPDLLPDARKTCEKILSK